MDKKKEPDQSPFQKKADWHKQQASLSLREKFRILLMLQEQDLALLKRHRELKWYERRWPVEP